MVRVVHPTYISSEDVRRLCERHCGRDYLGSVSDRLLADVDQAAPFLLGGNSFLLALANKYLRRRYAGDLPQISSHPLAENSIEAYANDLAYFLNTYEEPSLKSLLDAAVGGKLQKHFRDFVEKPEAELSVTTSSRRIQVANEFLDYVLGLLDSEINLYETLEQRTSRSRTGHSEQKLKYFKSNRPTKSTRRRHPSTIFILTPDELRTFFAAFLDPMLAASAKIIYGTGLRRHELAALNAGDIARLKPIVPGGPAFLRIMGKGRKERTVELEGILVDALQRFLISKARLQRVVLYLNRRGEGPGSRKVSRTAVLADNIPLLINRDGDRLSGRAIADGFCRASLRVGIKRLPHELRHEFAAAYLINTYKTLLGNIDAEGLEAWLMRLMIDKMSLPIIRLSHILGHADPELTKRVYLRALVSSDPAIRDAWNNHLDEMSLSHLFFEK